MNKDEASEMSNVFIFYMENLIYFLHPQTKTLFMITNGASQPYV